MLLPLRLLFRLAVVLAVGLTAGGCSGGRVVPEAEVVISERALRSHLRVLAEPVIAADSARAAERARYAAGRMRSAGLMPVLESSFLLRQDGSSTGPLLDPARVHVLGYVAGRHPSYADELVLVAADLDGTGAAAALEAARVLAEEARTTQVPERTVLVALWGPPRTGAFGLADYLAHPTWALDGVRRVLLVSADTAATNEGRRMLAARGIEAEALALGDRTVAEAAPEVERARAFAQAVRLTDALLARTRAAAAGTAE